MQMIVQDIDSHVCNRPPDVRWPCTPNVGRHKSGCRYYGRLGWAIVINELRPKECWWIATELVASSQHDTQRRLPWPTNRQDTYCQGCRQKTNRNAARRH